MEKLDEGKELSRDVSFHLHESGLGGGNGGGPASGKDAFQAIDYKQKGRADHIETIFSKSKAEAQRGSWPDARTDDTSTPRPADAPDWDPWFYLSYLLGFFLSVFGIAFLFSFCRKEVYQRAGIYGATASMFLINLYGLYFLTSLVWGLSAVPTLTLDTSGPTGAASGGAAGASLSATSSNALV